MDIPVPLICPTDLSHWSAECWALRALPQALGGCNPPHVHTHTHRHRVRGGLPKAFASSVVNVYLRVEGFSVLLMCFGRWYLRYRHTSTWRTGALLANIPRWPHFWRQSHHFLQRKSKFQYVINMHECTQLQNSTVSLTLTVPWEWFQFNLNGNKLGLREQNNDIKISK